MYARMARYRTEADRCNDAATSFRQAVEAISELPGFADGYVLIDPDSGEVVTLTLWESQAALDASEVRATGLRQNAAHAVAGDVESVGRFSVVIKA